MKNIKKIFFNNSTLLREFTPYCSYSLEGEDMVLRSLIRDKVKGLYVDVGANQPYRYSNTAYFYNLGWSGINIDASEESIRILKKYRKKDKNIHALISNINHNTTYYCYQDDALNTTSEVLMKHYKTNLNIFPIKKTKLNTIKLKTILGKYLNVTQNIDFMNVDVEGQELDVLKSSDWNKFRPNYLVVEDLHSGSLQEALKLETTKYLVDLGYIPVSKTVTNIIYRDKQWEK